MREEFRRRPELVRERVLDYVVYRRTVHICVLVHLRRGGLFVHFIEGGGVFVHLAVGYLSICLQNVKVFLNHTKSHPSTDRDTFKNV